MSAKLLLVALVFSGLAFGQVVDDSKDSAKPAGGALKGGSTSSRDTRRCEDLSGTLRDDCLKQQSKAVTGGTSAPESPAPAPRAPGEPPPQNPRR